MLEAVVVGCFGLIIGSFLNVLTLRFGFGEARRDRSGCMACGAPLTAVDLVPVVSYVALRGKCRTCGSKVSLQYPLVEVGTAALFVLSYLAAPPLTTLPVILGFVGLLVFWTMSMVLLVIDLRHTLVPLRYAYTLIAAAFLMRAAEALALSHAGPLIDALIGALVFGGGIALIVFVTRGRGMGSGDIYIAVALGLVFGLMRGIEVAALSFWIGAVVGLFIMFVQKRGTMKTELPFAPFLFAAAAIGMFTPFSPFVWIASILDTFIWR